MNGEECYLQVVVVVVNVVVVAEEEYFPSFGVLSNIPFVLLSHPLIS